MVTNVKQTADSNYLLVHNIPDGELKAILLVYAYL